MTLLERIFGVETMVRVREEARLAQARALAQSGARVPAAAPPRPAPRSGRQQLQAPPRVASGPAAPAMGVVPRVASVEPATAGGFIDVLPADFPTSILGTAAATVPPLLEAFASREALLAAIVYAEALAPPIALR